MENVSPFQLSTDRLRSLCDVVMGAVFVVLILNIDLPDLSHVTDTSNLSAVFLHGLPGIFSFFICFMVVAKCWQIHNLLFYHVKQVDNKMLWLTLFYLLSVIILVFTSGLHVRFNDKTVLIIFSVSLMLPALLLSMLCARVVYAWQIDESVYLSEARKSAAVVLMLKIFLIPAIAIASIILSYFNLYLSYYIWGLILLSIVI